MKPDKLPRKRSAAAPCGERRGVETGYFRALRGVKVKVKVKVRGRLERPASGEVQSEARVRFPTNLLQLKDLPDSLDGVVHLVGRREDLSAPGAQ